MNLAARICVAYANESFGAATTWRCPEDATSLDRLTAAFFALAYERQQKRRARVSAVRFQFLYTTN